MCTLTPKERDKLIAHCRNDYGPDDSWESLAAWVDGLKPFGTAVVLRASLTCVAESFALLDTVRSWRRSNELILANAGPLVEAGRVWAAQPTLANAQAAHRAALQTDELADRAGVNVTKDGEWWNHQAVQMCGLIPAAIAMHAGLFAADRDIPGPPEDELAAVCLEFSTFPSGVKRSAGRMRRLMASALVDAFG